MFSIRHLALALAPAVIAMLLGASALHAQTDGATTVPRFVVFEAFMRAT